MVDSLKIILSESNLQLISYKGKMAFFKRFTSTSSTMLKLKTLLCLVFFLIVINSMYFISTTWLPMLLQFK